MAIAIKFEDATDADLQSAVRVVGPYGLTAHTSLLIKLVLLKKERAVLIKHLRSNGYRSLLSSKDRVRPMHQTVKDSNAGADFLNALGYTKVEQQPNYAQRTLQFMVHGDLDNAVGRITKANRTYTQLGFKIDYKDENKHGEGRTSYDEHCYQVLDGPKLMGFMVLRWHRGEVHTRIELCPN